MPHLVTQHLGAIDYTDENICVFPAGLPGFDEETRFLILERPATAPVVFLQSLARPDLAFITLPAYLVDPAYELAATPEDLAALALPPSPEPGRDFLCLAIVTLSEGDPPTANLMAPIVVNLRTRQAWQVISMQSSHSARHPLRLPWKEGRPC